MTEIYKKAQFKFKVLILNNDRSIIKMRIIIKHVRYCVR